MCADRYDSGASEERTSLDQIDDPRQSSSLNYAMRQYQLKGLAAMSIGLSITGFMLAFISLTVASNTDFSSGDYSIIPYCALLILFGAASCVAAIFVGTAGRRRNQSRGICAIGIALGAVYLVGGGPLIIVTIAMLIDPIH